ncbi:MAG: glutaredoxin family protein [Actinomycetota bacterium]
MLLTQGACAYCDDAKRLLDRLSAEYGFSVKIVDLDSLEGQHLAEGGGVLFPPGVFIDGQPFAHGRPSERKLRRELDRRIGIVRRP